MNMKRLTTWCGEEMTQIKKKDIGNLLSQWNKEFSVFAPSRETGIVKMAKWDGEDTSFLDWYRNTVISPKADFLPNMEEMFGFQKDTEGYHLELPAPDETKRLFFGIRPCDAKALAILDMVFGEGYEDSYYLTRRQNTLLVGLGCTNPCDSCFCTSLGISPAESDDVDLIFIDIGDEFLIEAASDKGKELIAKTKELAESTPGDEGRAREAKETARQKVT